MSTNANPSRSNLIIGGLAAVIILELLAAWMTVAVYVKRDTSQFVMRTAGFLPIAKLGAYTINYGQFATTREAIKHFLNSPSVKASGQVQAMTPAIEKSAYERLLREAAGKELAAEKKISVTNEDIDKAYADFKVQASSTVPDVPKYIKETFDWNEQQYKDNVIRPQLLEEKLMGTFGTSTDPAMQFEEYLGTRLQKPDVKRYLNFPTQ